MLSVTRPRSSASRPCSRTRFDRVDTYTEHVEDALNFAQSARVVFVLRVTFSGHPALLRAVTAPGHAEGHAAAHLQAILGAPVDIGGISVQTDRQGAFYH